MAFLGLADGNALAGHSISGVGTKMGTNGRNDTQPDETKRKSAGPESRAPSAKTNQIEPYAKPWRKLIIPRSSVRIRPGPLGTTRVFE